MAIARLFSFVLMMMLLTSEGSGLTTSYISVDDEDITLRSIAVSNGKDNVQAIYSKPLSEYLSSLIEHDHFLDTSPVINPSTLDLNELRSNTKLTSEVINKNHADGLIHLQITKGPMGLLMELGLFTKKSGRLWAYAENLIKDSLDLENTKKIVQSMYTQIMNQIPYQGMILSRTGTRVTLNKGSLSKTPVDQDIAVIQVIGVTRHPQFQFVTHIQKEIIGKIRITKVDEKISFGYIIFEKEPQSIQPGFKVLLREPIYYPDLATSKNEDVVDYLLKRSDGQTMMRGDSHEWAPLNNPTFGRAHVLFGIGQLAASTNLSTEGGQQASTLLAFNAQVDADLWITKKWYLRAGLNQGSAQINNPLSGSAPSKLNYSLQNLKAALGYDFEISPSIYGPRMQAMLGYTQFNAKITESTPVAYTSTLFSGLGFGLAGYLPWYDETTRWGFGAELWYHLAPKISETPVSSGSPQQTQIVELSGSAHYLWKPNLSWIGKLTFDTFNSSFSGAGTRSQATTSSDLSWIRLNAGMEYLF